METVIKTKTKIEVELDTEVKDLVKELISSETQEEKQVIVHCTVDFHTFRIWKSTFLFDKNSDHRSVLVANYNIPLAPTWKHVTSDRPACFTLVFSALPKSCMVFSLREILPPFAGFGAPFIASNIKRNKSDIYEIIL